MSPPLDSPKFEKTTRGLDKALRNIYLHGIFHYDYLISGWRSSNGQRSSHDVEFQLYAYSSACLQKSHQSYSKQMHSEFLPALQFSML